MNRSSAGRLRLFTFSTSLFSSHTLSNRSRSTFEGKSNSLSGHRKGCVASPTTLSSRLVFKGLITRHRGLVDRFPFMPWPCSTRSLDLCRGNMWLCPGGLPTSFRQTRGCNSVIVATPPSRRVCRTPSEQWCCHICDLSCFCGEAAT